MIRLSKKEIVFSSPFTQLVMMSHETAIKPQTNLIFAMYNIKYTII